MLPLNISLKEVWPTVKVCQAIVQQIMAAVNPGYEFGVTTYKSQAHRVLASKTDDTKIELIVTRQVGIDAYYRDAKFGAGIWQRSTNSRLI